MAAVLFGEELSAAFGDRCDILWRRRAMTSVARCWATAVSRSRVSSSFLLWSSIRSSTWSRRDESCCCFDIASVSSPAMAASRSSSRAF